LSQLLVEGSASDQSTFILSCRQLAFSDESVVSGNRHRRTIRMKSSTARVAVLRKQRREQGMTQSTVWLSVEEQAIISEVQRRSGLKSQAEVIRLALRKISNKDNQMQP
jgi:hypothetical protein